jgi:hypothetical protein
MNSNKRKVGTTLAQSVIASANVLLKVLQTGSDAECQNALQVISSLLAEDAKRLQELSNTNES